MEYQTLKLSHKIVLIASCVVVVACSIISMNTNDVEVREYLVGAIVVTTLILIYFAVREYREKIRSPEYALEKHMERKYVVIVFASMAVAILCGCIMFAIDDQTFYPVLGGVILIALIVEVYVLVRYHPDKERVRQALIWALVSMAVLGLMSWYGYYQLTKQKDEFEKKYHIRDSNKRANSATPK